MEQAFQLGAYGVALFGGGFVLTQFRSKALDDASSGLVLGALFVWLLPLADLITGLDLTGPVLSALNNVSEKIWTLME